MITLGETGPTLTEQQIEQPRGEFIPRNETIHQRLSREKRALLNIYETPPTTADSIKRDICAINDVSPLFPNALLEGLSEIQNDLQDPNIRLEDVFNRPEYSTLFKRHLLREMYAQNRRATGGARSLDQIVFNAVDTTLHLKKITGENVVVENGGTTFDGYIVLTQALGYLLLDKSLSGVELEERLNMVKASIKKHIALLGIATSADESNNAEKEVYGIMVPIISNVLSLYLAPDALKQNQEGSTQLEAFFPETKWDAQMGIDGVVLNNGKFAAVIQSTVARNTDGTFNPVSITNEDKKGNPISTIDFPVHFFDLEDDIQGIKAMYCYNQSLKELAKGVKLTKKVSGRPTVRKDIVSKANLPIPNLNRIPEFKFINFVKNLVVNTAPGNPLNTIVTNGVEDPQVLYNIGIVPKRIETPEDVTKLLLNVGHFIRSNIQSLRTR